jgi:hypothetical protein
MLTIEHRFLTQCVVMLALAATSCRDAPLADNVRSNTSPIANAGEAQQLDYGGSPVSVTLDASGSSDGDGQIVGYRWLSGNKGDGGIGRGGPDPDDVEKPALQLDRGVWAFTLFVFDDAGGVSLPATVSITVGDAVSPEVSECAGGALPAISADCRTCACGVSDTCRTAIAGCNQGCWDFFTCEQKSCADLTGDELANCVRSNCSAFFGGVAQYMAVEPCIAQGECAEACAASARM